MTCMHCSPDPDQFYRPEFESVYRTGGLKERVSMLETSGVAKHLSVDFGQSFLQVGKLSLYFAKLISLGRWVFGLGLP